MDSSRSRGALALAKRHEPTSLQTMQKKIREVYCCLNIAPLLLNRCVRATRKHTEGTTRAFQIPFEKSRRRPRYPVSAGSHREALTSVSYKGVGDGLRLVPVRALTSQHRRWKEKMQRQAQMREEYLRTPKHSRTRGGGGGGVASHVHIQTKMDPKRQRFGVNAPTNISVSFQRSNISFAPWPLLLPRCGKSTCLLGKQKLLLLHARGRVCAPWDRVWRWRRWQAHRSRGTSALEKLGRVNARAQRTRPALRLERFQPFHPPCVGLTSGNGRSRGALVGKGKGCGSGSGEKSGEKKERAGLWTGLTRSKERR